MKISWKTSNKPKKTKTDGYISALSWNIATEPKLYRELISNPFSSIAKQIISDRFPNENPRDVIKAAVLAEPEGIYDRNFKKLGVIERESELSRQIENANEINKRLKTYFKMHKKQLSRLPKSFLYDNLFRFVFETADLRKVEQKYSQKLRRDAKLSIVNLTHDLQKSNNLFVVKISNEKIALARPLLLIIFAVFCLSILFHFTQSNRSSKSAYQSLANQGESNVYRPTRLKIPSIQVDAAMEYVGLTSTGEMGVPNETDNVGWFNLGVRPGEIGTAVIAGHVDSENSATAVFTNLNKLKEGDKLYVEDSNGKITTFVVREIRTFVPGQAKEVFSSLSDGAHLNLVTCIGAWNYNKKSYSNRLVVFSDKVE